MSQLSFSGHTSQDLPTQHRSKFWRAHHDLGWGHHSSTWAQQNYMACGAWEPQPCKPLSLAEEVLTNIQDKADDEGNLKCRITPRNYMPTHIYWILWPEMGKMLDRISIFHSVIEHKKLHGVLGVLPSLVWSYRSIPPFVEFFKSWYLWCHHCSCFLHLHQHCLLQLLFNITMERMHPFVAQPL